MAGTNFTRHEFVRIEKKANSFASATKRILFELITSNWEWFLLGLYVVETAIKLSPSKKDDLIWDMVLKPM